MTATKFSVARFDADAAPQPDGMRCVRVFVPDDDFYVRLLAAVVNLPTMATNWEGEQENRDAVAALFNSAYTFTDWDGCMDCATVQDCIETDEGTQNAITNLMQSQQGFPPQYPYGENLPDEALSRDFADGTNPGCDLDILWAQCLAIAVGTNSSILFVLNQTEVTTNVVELADKLFQSVPLLATAYNASGLDGALDLINYFQESVLEEYAAQYTTTPGGVQDTIACALFCACKDDCVITIERIVNVLSDRLAVYTTPPSLDGLTDLIETLAGVSVDTTFVVDLAFYVSWGMVKVANFLFGNRFDNVLQIWLALAVNDANNDWMILCTDCPDFGNILQFTTPINFGGTEDNSQPFTPGEAMMFTAINYDTGRYSVCLYAPDGDYTQEYTISPDPVNAPGTEICWLYTDTSDMTQLATGATEVASDFPTPIDVRMEQGSNLKCSWWHAAEAFTITVTFTAL